MALQIPERNKDLRRLVLRRRLTKAGLYLLWLAALFVGVFRFNAGHERHPMAAWQLAIWLGGGAVVGFLLLRGWMFFTERPFVGRVTKSGLSHGIKGDDFRLNTAIRVDDEAGKRHRLRFEQKAGFYLLYHEGVRVCKLPFLVYPLPDPATVPVPETASANSTDDCASGAFCVVCGKTSAKGAEVCEACGYSLIDPAALFGKDLEGGKP